jgi:putative ABC transport system substrate-binding protein
VKRFWMENFGFSIGRSRSQTLFFVCALLLSPCFSAEAQQTGKVARIGFLDAGTAAGSAGLLDTFRQEMRKLGWIEGKNITTEYRFAEAKTERRPELAADLVRLRVDLILVS